MMIDVQCLLYLNTIDQPFPALLIEERNQINSSLPISPFNKLDRQTEPLPFLYTDGWFTGQTPQCRELDQMYQLHTQTHRYIHTHKEGYTN